MKTIQILTLTIATMSLSSCALLSSILRIPGSIVQTAARTVGMPIKHVEEEQDPTPETMQEDGTFQRID